jgi:tRNA-2-methylthio-N6-dimethylallyladenosine synthase
VSRRVYIETYGCEMNVADTELMAGVLAERGYLRVEEPSEADVILVNTCAIRENAERRVKGRIGQLQKHRDGSPELVLGVTGCMAQRIGDRLVEEVDGVDLVAGPDSYRQLGEMVDAIRSGGLERGQALLELDAAENYEGMEGIREEGVTAWITVQRGCDHRCTFCIVPYVRGPEKNRHPHEILGEVREVADRGFTEVTLLGQTVNSYAFGAWDFARLLRAVARVDGIRRVRFTSPHPNDVTPELVEVMATEPAVCRQIHLPAQSGSDRMLKRMVRRYTVDEYLEKVEMLRDRIPEVAISTDMIVAFPGETREEFEATLDLMRRVRYDDAFLYRYSPRPGTPATRFPEEDFVDDAEAQERLERLIEVHREIQAEINRGEVGADRRVLVEREAKSDGDVLGRTEGNKVVAFPGAPEEIGTYHRVRLTSTSGATFRGRRIS